MNTFIDTTFTMYTDTPIGRDPDTYSPTLRNYHLLLWNKTLPNGNEFYLAASDNPPYYLYHKSELGEFTLSSDSIIHTYRKWKREPIASVTREIPGNAIDEFYNLACTIGGYIIFPSNKINGKLTINGIRGIHPSILDRFDLTLECIRCWYLRVDNPLYPHIDRYRDFFQLFVDFKGYYSFFLLDNLIDNDTGSIRFWLPFDGFEDVSPLPKTTGEYQEYRLNVSEFVNKRNQQIEKYMKR